MPVVLVCRAERPSADERALQRQLAVAMLGADAFREESVPLYLRLEEAGLTLYAPGLTGKGLRVDFNASTLRRRARESLKRTGLGKAVGLKSGQQPWVLDATAGLGTDAFLLANSGCAVTLCERSPVVFALLADGMRRGLLANSESAPALTRMTLWQGDFLDFPLDYTPPAAGQAYDVVYLDPMFPVTGKSARAGKAMFMLQQLLPPEPEAATLLNHALELASNRVVVKRARLSPFLGDMKPHHSLSGRSNRYDVYLAKSD